MNKNNIKMHENLQVSFFFFFYLCDLINKIVNTMRYV